MTHRRHLAHLAACLGALAWGCAGCGAAPATGPSACPPAAGAAPPARVALRVLVIGASDEAPYLAARAALQRLGVPHEAVSLASRHLAEVPLRDADGSCRFRGVILATGGLSSPDRDRLARYEKECDARELIWYATPGPESGLTEIARFGSEDAVHGSLTPAGAAVFGDLAKDVDIDFSGNPGTLARAEDPEVTTPLVVTARGAALVATHCRADGTAVLAMTAGSGPNSLFAMILQHGLVAWLMRDLYPGERRVYLTPQVDDVFIPSNVWTPDGSPLTYRADAGDIANLLAWQRRGAARLPAGSTFTSSMAFNGFGADPVSHPDPLVAALLAGREELGWISHTWDHASMASMSETDAAREIADNVALAREAKLPGFDPAAVVTPSVSGLDNPDAIRGMVSAGIRVVVTDASITSELDPGNPGDNPSHNVGRDNRHDPLIYEVPRHPTSVFFDASTPTQEVGLYNQIYRDANGRDLSYPEIVARNAGVGLRYLVGYDADPLMFHQANLRAWKGADGRLHSLYGDWIDAALDRYLATMKLPVLSLTMKQLAELMKRRGAYDECGAEAVLVDDGGAGHLEITGRSRCVVPLSGLDAPGAGRVEHYGGEATTYVELDPGETRFIDRP